VPPEASGDRYTEHACSSEQEIPFSRRI